MAVSTHVCQFFSWWNLVCSHCHVLPAAMLIAMAGTSSLCIDIGLSRLALPVQDSASAFVLCLQCLFGRRLPQTVSGCVCQCSAQMPAVVGALGEIGEAQEGVWRHGGEASAVFFEVHADGHFPCRPLLRLGQSACADEIEVASDGRATK